MDELNLMPEKVQIESAQKENTEDDDLVVSEYLKCSICFQVFTNPMITPCQHTFCKVCIIESLDKAGGFCPLCRSKIRKDNLLVNRMAANMIEERSHFLGKKKEESGVGSVIKLTIQKNYAPHWTSRHGIREIVQNWYDGAVDRVSSPKKLQIISDTKLSGFTTYQAAPIDDPSQALAYIEFDPSKERLSFVNFNVSLSRNILLLGVSGKKGKKELVGQFGEGLKIGILALTRENKHVSMKTNNQLWDFQLELDHNFGEEVLSIHTSQLPNISTTTTIVEGITSGEWNTYVNDFLFLKKPNRTCETGTGTLLLDEELKHKLYVKGFFISNMKDDGLLWGVNLHELQIDRDRTAVVHKYDIDTRVSDIWARAIVTNKELLPLYYEMLKNDHVMIRNSIWNLTQEGISMLADYFIQQEGHDAFPLLNTTKDNRADMNAILCPESLFTILNKSNKFVLKKEDLNPEIKMENLNEDEKCVVENVLSLVRECISPSISFVVIDSKEEKRVVIPSNGPISISKQLLDLQFVHQEFSPRCMFDWSNNVGQIPAFCFCRETHILNGIISESALKKGANMSRAYEKLLSEKLIQKLIEKSFHPTSSSSHLLARLQSLEQQTLQLQIENTDLKKQLLLYR